MRVPLRKHSQRSHRPQLGLQALEVLTDNPSAYSLSLPFEEDEISCTQSRAYRNGAPNFTPLLYEYVGKALMISLLDIVDKNPVSRIKHWQASSLREIRTELAEKQIARSEKLRKLASKKKQEKIDGIH